MMQRALGIALWAAWAAPLYAAHPYITDDLDLDLGVRRRLNRAEFDTAILLGATFRW